MLRGGDAVEDGRSHPYQIGPCRFGPWCRFGIVSEGEHRLQLDSDRDSGLDQMGPLEEGETGGGPVGAIVKPCGCRNPGVAARADDRF
jgi:hypothetical protein